MTLFKIPIQPSEAANTDLQIVVNSGSGGFYKKGDATVVFDSDRDIYFAQATIITIADGGETPPTAIPDGLAIAQVNDKATKEVFNSAEYTFVAGVEQVPRSATMAAEEMLHFPERTINQVARGAQTYKKITDKTQGPDQVGVTVSDGPIPV